jgi:excisionase family DNA binding protein
MTTTLMGRLWVKIPELKGTWTKPRVILSRSLKAQGWAGEMQSMKEPRFTIKQAAEYLGISRGSLKGYIDRGELPYELHKGRGKGKYRFIRIRKSDLDALAARIYRSLKVCKEKRHQSGLVGYKSQSGPGLILLPRKVAAEQAKSLY